MSLLKDESNDKNKGLRVLCSLWLKLPGCEVPALSANELIREAIGLIH